MRRSPARARTCRRWAPPPARGWAVRSRAKAVRAAFWLSVRWAVGAGGGGLSLLPTTCLSGSWQHQPICCRPSDARSQGPKTTVASCASSLHDACLTSLRSSTAFAPFLYTRSRASVPSRAISSAPCAWRRVGRGGVGSKGVQHARVAGAPVAGMPCSCCPISLTTPSPAVARTLPHASRPHIKPSFPCAPANAAPIPKAHVPLRHLQPPTCPHAPACSRRWQLGWRTPCPPPAPTCAARPPSSGPCCRAVRVGKWLVCCCCSHSC